MSCGSSSIARSAAWQGTPLEETADEPMLSSDYGTNLGFVRVTARRGDETPLVFGPGRYTTRLA